MISWFKYFTEPAKLEVDFDSLADSDKLRLLRDFLHEADQSDRKMELSRRGGGEPLSVTLPGVASTDLHNNGYLGDNSRENYIQQMRKSQVLYVLALKVFANLKYNINLIHDWGVPLCLIGNLQRTFLRVSTGIPNFNPLQDVDWPGWTGVSRFAQVVYHFWTLLEGLDRVLIKSHKRCLTPPLPGLTEVPDIVFVNESNIEENSIVSRLEQSAQILTILLELDDVVFEVPTSRSYKIPDLDSDTTEFDELTGGAVVSTDSINSNIMFFLGRHCFQRKEFDKAFMYFTNAKASMDTNFNHLHFMGLTPMLLESYISLCHKLSHKMQSRFRSTFQIIEDQMCTKQWDVELLTDILMKELFRRFERKVVDVLNSAVYDQDITPINLHQREQLEKEMKLSLNNESDKIGFFKVSICNLLERVISGHAILTTFISDLSNLTDNIQVRDVLKYLNQQTISCLNFFQETKLANFKPSEEMKRSSSCPNIFSEEIPLKNDFNLEIQNIKCFVIFLNQTLPSEMEFPAITFRSDLVKYLSPEEVEEIKAIMNDVVLSLDDLDIYDLENVECDWFSIHDRKCQPLDNESERFFNFETNNDNEMDTLRLLSSYDCGEIKEILLRLHGNNSVSRHTIADLCIHWNVSAALTDEIKNIKNEFEYIYVYILLAKGDVLRDLKSWDMAKFHYDTVKSITNNNKLKKLVNNEIICNDLQRFLFNYQDLNPKKFCDENHTDLVNCTKSCITSARIDNNLWVTETLITCCCCFLLTVNEYDYLLNIPNTVSTTVELSSLLITVCRDFEKLTPSTKFVKSSKDLFDFLLKVVVPTKKTGVYNCMNQQQLRLFIELLGNCSLLDLLISALVSILTCLRSDINLSRPLFPKDIWPTTISSNFNTSIDTTHLDSLVLFSIDKALNQNPHNFNWLFIKADLALSENDYFKTMKHYLEAGAAATEFYTKPITKDIFNDWILQQMIRSCREMGYYHQAIFLCQYIPEINIAAQLANQVTVSNDSSDLYIHLMWDLNLMEILAAIEYDRGAFSKHKKFIDAISQPDMSSNNSPVIILNCQERKKLEFLRVISMQYTMR